jgi:hypothetical protein
MFEIASTGAAGVNFHTGPRYGAFWSFHRRTIRVLPLYYGMYMFAQAAPAGSRLIPMQYHSNANVKIWMTLDRHHTARIVMINKDLRRNVIIALRLPAKQPGQLERLTAPRLTARTRIEIGGLTFRGSHLGQPSGTTVTASVPSTRGRYAISLARGSAALLTIRLY